MRYQLRPEHRNALVYLPGIGRVRPGVFFSQVGDRYPQYLVAVEEGSPDPSSGSASEIPSETLPEGAPPGGLNGEVPAGYDDLNVASVAALLDLLSDDDLAAVREHEVRGKNRKTVLREIDRRME